MTQEGSDILEIPPERSTEVLNTTLLQYMARQLYELNHPQAGSLTPTDIPLPTFDEWVKGKLNIFERAGEAISSTDEYLRYIAMALSYMARAKVEIPELISLIASIDALVASMGGLPGSSPSSQIVTREVPFSYQIGSKKGALLEDTSPLTGRIVGLIRQWPDGCNNLVYLAIGHGETQMSPQQRGQYVNLNDVALATATSESVIKSEKLWVEILNKDDTYAHQINVSFILIGKLEEEVSQ